MSQANLPTLQELHLAPEEAFKQDALNILLNQPVPEKWIKLHPMVADLKYLPIDKVEFLLTRIFQEWKAEVVSYSALFQSVSVHVRLHYKNPVTGLWSFQDGLGAVPVQTDTGASAADLGKIKSNAITLALPAAESYAIKDAAEKLGVLFGKNLNRKDAAVFQQGSYMQGFETDPLAELKLAIKSEFTHIKNQGQLQEYWNRNKKQFSQHEEISKLFSNYKMQLATVPQPA